MDGVENIDANLIETRINSKEIYHGRLLHVFRDEVRLPDGRTAEREWIKHPSAAAVVPITEEGEVIMVRQYRYPVRQVTLEIPAGKLDAPDEPGYDCAVRELEEETGYRSSDVDWLMTLRTTVAFCDEKIEIFVARNLKAAKQNLDENEYVDVKSFTIEELKEKIYTGAIQDSKTIAAILAYEDKYVKNK